MDAAWSRKPRLNTTRLKCQYGLLPIQGKTSTQHRKHFLHKLRALPQPLEVVSPTRWGAIRTERGGAGPARVGDAHEDYIII